MDRICARQFGGVEDFLTDQIGFASSRRANAYSLVCFTHMKSARVRSTVNSNRTVTKASGSADNASRYLATICDQYFCNFAHGSMS
jgi:WD40 repeat protein